MIMTLKRVLRALIVAIPYVGSSLEQLFFGSQDDKEIKRIKDNIAKSDKALGVRRDENGSIINNPYNFGEI